MSTELHCVHCGGGLEYPPELQGDKLICPHCNTQIPFQQPSSRIETRSKYSTRETKAVLAAVGIVVSIIGSVYCATTNSDWLVLWMVVFLVCLVIFVVGGFKE